MSCDILSQENVLGVNKTVSIYDSRQKEVAVQFQAGQRTAAGIFEAPCDLLTSYWLVVFPFDSIKL